jgi:hypothetical protein
MKAYKYIPTSAHQSKIVGALPTQIPKGVKGDFDPHQIVRQASMAGYQMPDLKARPLKNEKNVLYNKSEIKRPAFLNVKILPRQLPDFDRLQADNIERFGQKVQIDPKSLGNYFNEERPDETDYEWIRAKDKLVKRYDAEGKSSDEIEELLQRNKPLGRNQRTTLGKPTSGADRNVSQKLNKIEEAVKGGLQENKENQVILIGELTKILAKSEGSTALIEANRKLIQDIMEKLDVPISREAYNLPKYVDYSNYMKQQGIINLYLTKKAYEEKGDPVRPVLSHASRKHIELNSVKSSLYNGNILDLENSAMFTKPQIKRMFNSLEPGEYAFDGQTLNFMRHNNKTPKKKKPKTPKTETGSPRR